MSLSDETENVLKLRERASRGYPDAMASLADAGEDLSFLSAEQRTCAWCQTFHPRLAEGMVVCQIPPLFFLLSSLKLGHSIEMSSRLATEFLEAAACPDKEVSARARAALADLSLEMIDSLCDYALSPRCTAAARELWVELGHLPSAPHRRQIYLIRMNQLDRAEELDPHGQHLVTAAAELRPSWRLLLAAILRERGRGHLVARMLGLAHDNVQLDGPMLAEMLRQKQFDALWRLAPFVSAERAREIILELGEREYSGGDHFARALALATLEPDLHPVFRQPGQWLGWGGSRVLVHWEGQARAIDWKQGEIVWTAQTPVRSALVSPDGMWASLRRGSTGLIELHDSNGLAVPGVTGSKSWCEFSPCSRYYVREGRARGSRQIWRLAPARRLRTIEVPHYHWVGNGQLMVTRNGLLQHYDLANGTLREEPVPVSETVALRWERSTHGTRLVGLLARPESLIVERDGSSRRVTGHVQLLADERVICSDRTEIWDGRTMKSLPRPFAGWSFQDLDRKWARVVLGFKHVVGLARLGDSAPYRVFPGKFIALHPNEPYLATLLEGDIAIWHAPPESPLGPSALHDQAAQLEPYLRPLALFLLHHRFQHEVSLEDGLELSPAHEIQLD